MSTLILDIPKSWWHTSNDRGHWRKFASRKAAIREATRRAALEAGLGPFHVAHVTAHIGYPRAGTADPGNAAPVVKAALDGLTDAGVWDDDDSRHVIGPDYRRDPCTGRPGIHTLRLTITETDTSK